MAKSIEQWINAYAVSHQHPQNVLIHHLCVPLIFLSVVAIVHFISPWLLLVSGCLASAFYLRLGFKPLLTFWAMAAASLFVTGLFNLSLQILIVIFLLAWIGQFIGHKIEGAKPSLFDDLKFLLIGPLWLFSKWLIKQNPEK
ncbi:MAG TPA: DUF962 domain-containing protein [Oceanospirillaceae bacterium]|nr:DUF962 domain-containing protein [Oceanospirillaceae bacterium]